MTSELDGGAASVTGSARVRLGRSDLTVRPIGLGCMRLSTDPAVQPILTCPGEDSRSKIYTQPGVKSLSPGLSALLRREPRSCRAMLSLLSELGLYG